MIHTEKTLSEVLNILKERGYTEDYNLLEVKESYLTDGKKVNLEDLIIDKIYRFSNHNDVGDESILYAMRNIKDGTKGVFVNGYGIYTDDEATAIISKIAKNEHVSEDFSDD